MCKKPKVCICIPNYNNANTIEETLDSLVNQTYKNIIIKILDNASTDNSLQIIKKYQEKYENIGLIENKTNIGAEANFDKCIEYMEGKYSAIFHSDDIYEPTIVEKEVDMLENYNICAVSTLLSIIDKNSLKTDIYSKIPNQKYKKEKYFFNFYELFELVLKNENFIACPSVMAITKIYKEKIRCYNYESFGASCDLDVWLRFSEISKFGIIAKPLLRYRTSENSYSTRNKYEDTIGSDFLKVLQYYVDKYPIFNKGYLEYQELKFQFSSIRNKLILKQSLDNIIIRNFSDKRIFMIILKDKRKVRVYLICLLVKWIQLLKLCSIFEPLLRKMIKI